MRDATSLATGCEAHATAPTQPQSAWPRAPDRARGPNKLRAAQIARPVVARHVG